MSKSWQWQAAKAAGLELESVQFGQPIWKAGVGNWHDYNLIRKAFEEYGSLH